MQNNPSNKKSFNVEPSPLNPVKFELAIIILVGIVFWLVINSIIKDQVTQIILLLLYSCLGTGWTVLRIRNIVSRVRSQQ